MAVEYEISSDVAVIKETGSVSQCARVTQMYSGQITYDDEAGSKFATATINGKSQRVMLCIAVNGTVTYDDVPSLYSTVDGHRCLNIVTPTETGTPDDVPSLYETVVIDGQNVRAVRCIMINKTPVYDGVSSTCTFTGDDGKTHTAQLVNKITGGSVEVIIKGISPLVLPDAIANSLSYIKAFGGTEQRNLPEGYTQRNFIYMMDGSYLLTDLVPTYDCKIEMDFQTTTTAGSPVTYLGARTDTTDGAGLRLGHITNKKFRIYGFGGSQDSTDAATNDTRYKYVWDNQRATITSGGTTVLDQTFTDTGTTTDYLAINAWNTNGSITGNVEGIYLYSFKMWDNQGELIADYVPAVQKGTVPVVGFYDTVSQTFKGPTAGTFAAGSEATPTPDAPMDIVCNNGVVKWGNPSNIPNDYTELEYVKTPDDGGVYVDTQIEGATRVVLDVMGTERSSATVFYLFGQMGESGYQKGVTQYQATWSGGFNVSQRQILDCTFSTSAIVINGVNISNRTLDNDVNIGLFGTGNNTTRYLRGGYLYSCKIYDGETLVRDFVPAKNSSNVIGLYDKVSGTFFRSATSTNLQASEAVDRTIIVDGTVETIGVHSKNLFDPTIASYESFGVTSPTANIRYGHIYRNGTYTIKQNVSGTQIYAKLVSGESYGTALQITTTRTLTVSGDDMILVYSASATPKDVTEYKVQVEQGTSATEYQPYFDGGTATAEMLMAIGNDKDQQEIIGGTVTRNIGYKIFDGSETFGSSSAYGQALYINRSIAADWGANNSKAVLCTHFLGKPMASSAQDLYTCFFNSSGHFYFRTEETEANFKTWLTQQYAAGTPVIVYFVKTDATTESVAGQALTTGQGDNVAEITQASLTGLELEVEYQAAVSLTIQEVEDAQLSPDVEVTIQ